MHKINIRRKAQLGLDIQYGGRAIPIARNMVYFDGNSHAAGGIGVSNNLEVEGGEVGEKKGGTLRIFSAVPFLSGMSPAQLVMGGANPNKVFKAQEDFKDNNRIKDDGTHYQVGGKKKSNSAIRTEDDKKVSAYNRAVYSAVDATSDYPKWWQAIALGAGSNLKAIINPDTMNYSVTDSIADAAWRKRLGLSYDNKHLIDNKDGSVRLPKHLEREIPTDTIMLKKRIIDNEKFANQSNIVGEDWKIVQSMIDKDKEALNALRKTYKTGEPVVINEYAHNSRNLSKDGELIKGAINYKSPLNVMRNYTIQYNPKTRQMDYRDVYDFNEFEWGVPGKPFEIKGSIPLKRFGGSTKDDTKTAALKRLRNKFTIAGNYGGGLFGGAGAGSVIMEQPEYVNDTIVKRYLVPITQTFNDAFKNARNNGQNEFMFDGKLYNTNLGDNPNNNAAGANRTSTIIIPIEHKEIKRRKKELGGSMIYEINGNVKNGLMSARPKAQYGTEKKINANTKIGEDGLIYTKAIDGDWYTDGTRYEDSKYYMGRKSAQAYSREKFKRQPKAQSLDEVVVTGTRPKAKEESKPITTSSNNGNTITTQTIEGKQVDYPKTNTGYKPFTYKKDKDGKLVKVYDDDKRYNNSYIRPNREGANYKPNRYNPLTGENVDEQGIVKTSEPSIIGTTKVSSSTSSTPRGRGTKASKSATSTKPANIEAKQPKIVERPKENLYIAGIKNNAVKSPLMVGMEKISANRSSSSTGGETQPKDGRWVGQYKTTNVGDWIGLGANLAGTIGSYFINKSSINKMPMPLKPVAAQAAKLKTRYNINPQLTEIREAEQMNRVSVRRNTQSSSSSLAREQRLMNEARGARNVLYGQKENIETQLINQDRLNRQSVMRDNVRTYNDYLNRLTATRQGQNELKVSNVNNLISGLTGSVNSILGNIESRRATNNTIRAIAAANPNVDARLIGGFDYYIDPITRRKYNKNQQYVGTINS